MRLDDLVLRYQQKIGSYDKQKWEKSLEEEIKVIENAFPLKNTTIKNDLIDVDLVRGSTFQKQKPKQTVLQVLYLSILRYLLLPIFSKWWLRETSPKTFLVLILLYFLQMVNLAIYSLHVRGKTKNGDDEESTVELCELFIPMGLSLLLCFTHSQIVCTATAYPIHKSSSSNRSRRHHFKSRDKCRRKKKHSRQRHNSDNLIKGYDSDDEQSVSLHKIEKSTSHESDISATVQLRRRNVNWNLNDINSIRNDEGISRLEPLISPRSTEDDGFESFKEKDESNSDTGTLRNTPVKINRDFPFRQNNESSESEDVDSPNACSSNQFETTDGEYMIGVTSNSEGEDDEYQNSYNSDDDDGDNFPTKILNSNDSSERISVTVWTKHEAKKAEMNVFEISSAIINRVDSIPETSDYLYIGMVFAVLLALTPAYCRLCDVNSKDVNSTNIIFDLPKAVVEETFSFTSFVHVAFSQNFWIGVLLIISTIQRLVLAFFFFFLLAVAERTFKQRFLYSKLFSHLTSARRAQKSLIPHFRLSKVKNIKGWLSIRSYLKRLGPQRSVDLIVSTAFITTLILLAFLSLEFLKDSDHIHSQLNLEALVWSCALGLYLLRFFTLGAKTNKKYRSISVLITEQINLYVQIEKKPQKKEELNVSSSVLKLAENLLKELDSPFKISGISANSYLYNIAKVVVLSALSGVLSEMLGFKLKLHKIKIK